MVNPDQAELLNAYRGMDNPDQAKYIQLVLKSIKNFEGELSIYIEILEIYKNSKGIKQFVEKYLISDI